MRQRKFTVIVFLLLFCISGCEKKESKYSNKSSSVDNVLEQKINNIDAEKEANTKGKEEQQDSSTEYNVETTPQNKTSFEEEKTKHSSNNKVDYDLTTMGSDMVYATVFQIMREPDTYQGKTIKMQGIYNATYYEPTKQYYHYCIIQDATACCAQGLEFIWGNGSHLYPEEYPKNETEIVVTGTFETYHEDGDENLYCRLKDATMEVVQE